MSSKDAYRKGVSVSATISPRASIMLDDLLSTGMFGLNRASIVREAIYRFLREHRKWHNEGEVMEPDGGNE